MPSLPYPAAPAGRCMPPHRSLPAAAACRSGPKCLGRRGQQLAAPHVHELHQSKVEHTENDADGAGHNGCALALGHRGINRPRPRRGRGRGGRCCCWLLLHGGRLCLHTRLRRLRAVGRLGTQDMLWLLFLWQLLAKMEPATDTGSVRRRPGRDCALRPSAPPCTPRAPSRRT